MSFDRDLKRLDRMLKGLKEESQGPFDLSVSDVAPPPPTTGSAGASDQALSDQLDSYLDQVIGPVLDLEDADWDEDEAIDLALDVAEEMAADGRLPSQVPDEGADGLSIATWMAAAKTTNYAQEVLQAAKDAVFEDDEEGDEEE